MKKFESRYENKEFQKKPDNLISTLLSVIRMALMIAGVIGIANNLFKDHGWLAMGFNALSKNTSTFLVGGAVLLIIIYFADKMLSSKAEDGKASNRGDLALYAMMAAGVYFIIKFVME